MTIGGALLASLWLLLAKAWLLMMLCGAFHSLYEPVPALPFGAFAIVLSGHLVWRMALTYEDDL